MQDMGVGVLFESVRTLMWLPNCQCQYSDRSVCNIGTQVSIFRSIHLQHWYRNYQMSIFRSIHLQHWYPNYQMSMFRWIRLQHWYPNVNIQIGSIRNPFGWGRNPNIIPGAAIRMCNHNYEDRNYDLNAQPHVSLCFP